MPKIGAEPIRKAALINAAIAAVGRAGSLDVTVAQIAREAGMSSALAHHYFGSKDQMFLAAMRHVLNGYHDAVTARLPLAETPRARLQAIIDASFDPQNFQQEVISAWLNFYALSRVNDQAARLLRVYHGRLRSNLMVALRPLCRHPERVTDTLAALIDGVYLRAALGRGPADGASAIKMITDYLDEVLT
ncbi:choline-responsive transcriptional repressor BetI [Paracoccus tegillarcae]|uniref:HTH-type transcriptional regulator BetI n=1 Tax=Paracoccus tegillarcae TaxID=1529068 RepID=A0A2K9EI34_9RHOB|nr:transcriptional regulator BetI [Paracoccus tegillarcae]AUH34633.1 transcriptional regulator BetI [Paracoccus tegillarcae]